MIKNLNDFVIVMDQMASMGWIKTHRSGTTGIGKTLEDLLGIKENNNIGPDFGVYELKAARKNDNSMLTLFTKSPQPRGINLELLKKYGYSSNNYKNNKKVLHTTLSAEKPTPISTTGKCLKIECKDEKIIVVGSNGSKEAYWDRKVLKETFEKKYVNSLIYVEAEARGKGKDEKFLFNVAYELSGFNYESIIDLLKKGIIKIDIRIGQYSDGKTHDHGTAFRIEPQYFENLFLNKNEIWRRSID